MADYEWTIALASCGLAATLIGLGAARVRRDCRSLRLEGIRATRMAKRLLVNLQQHRGMAAAYLSGDRSFAARLEQKQAAIEQDMAALDAERALGLMTLPRWDALRQGWNALREGVLGMPLEESFRQHSELIRGVLYLMGDMAERSQIGGTCGADAALVNALWTKLPAAAEGLGQARGVGAGVAAKGHCSGVARIKLRFLAERIGETMERVSGDLQLAARTDARITPVARSWESAHGDVREFLSLLDTALLKADTPAIDAERYFAAATRTLDAVYQVFDQASDVLQNAVAEPAPA